MRVPRPLRQPHPVQPAQVLTAAGVAAPHLSAANWPEFRGPTVQGVVADGALPDGLALDPAGRLTGTPAQPGTFQFSLQAADCAGSSAVQTFTASVLLAAAPAVNVSGISDFVQPAQQPGFDITLGSTYPVPLSGTVTLSFSPDAGINVDDPAIRLSNGTRSMSFTVPPNNTSVNFAAPIAAGIAQPMLWLFAGVK